MKLVIDCSVTAAWCFEDEADDYADQVLGALRRKPALAPSIRPLEIANVLAAAERRGRLRKADSVRFVELLDSLPIRVEETTFRLATGAVLAAARDFELSAYDAAYLELAMREGGELATNDRKLVAAADRAGVALFG